MTHESCSNSAPSGDIAQLLGAYPSANGQESRQLSNGYPVLSKAIQDLNSSLYGSLGRRCEPIQHRDIGTRFGLRLRELRRTQGMTQIDMAVMLGIDRSYISEVECGKKGISLATLEIIALGLRLRLSDLFQDL